MNLEKRELKSGGPAIECSSPQSTALLQGARGVYASMYPEVEEKWILMNINNLPQFPMTLKIISTPIYDKGIETVYFREPQILPRKGGRTANSVHTYKSSILSVCSAERQNSR